MHFKMTALVLCLLASRVVGEDLQRLRDSLRPELLVAIKTLSASAVAQDGSQKRNLEFLFLTLTRDWDDEQARRGIPNALARVQKESPSEKLRDLCGRLAGAIQKQDAREMEEFRKRLHATVRAALEKGLAATSVRELDAPLADLAALSEDAMRFDARNATDLETHQRMPFSEAVRTAISILSTYQNGLFGKPDVIAMERRSAPSQELESWISSNRAGEIPTDIISHEELSAKIQVAAARISPEKTHEISDKEYEAKTLELAGRVTKLEDLADAFAQIDALRGHQNRREPMVVSRLRGYHMIYQKLRSGKETEEILRINDTISPVDSNPTLATIKRQLMRHGLAQVLRSSPALPQKEDESADDFLRRVLSTACAAHDWQMIPRAMQAAQLLRLDNVVQRSDWGGFNSLLQAVNMDRAGVPSEAAGNYLAALQSGSDLIPADYIRVRLRDIHQQFSEAFDGVIPESSSASKPQH